MKKEQNFKYYSDVLGLKRVRIPASWGRYQHSERTCSLSPLILKMKVQSSINVINSSSGLLPVFSDENLFIYGLFKDNMSSSDSVASNGRIFNEY